MQAKENAAQRRRKGAIVVRCTVFPKANLRIELETLNAELADAEKRLQAADDEGRKVIGVQIKQIKRDIRRYSTRLKVAERSTK